MSQQSLTPSNQSQNMTHNS